MINNKGNFTKKSAYFSKLISSKKISGRPAREVSCQTFDRKDRYPLGLSSAIDELASQTDKAMYISEAGADSFNSNSNSENEAEQAQATEIILNKIIENSDLCIGVTLFEFCDEWWKAGNPEIQDVGGWAPNSSGVPYDGSPNEEYWGIVNIDRTKKKAFDTVKARFK